MTSFDEIEILNKKLKREGERLEKILDMCYVFGIRDIEPHVRVAEREYASTAERIREIEVRTG